MDAIEEMYKAGKPGKQRFSVSAPRASYISDAFTHFSTMLGQEDAVDVVFTILMIAIINENLDKMKK